MKVTYDSIPEVVAKILRKIRRIESLVETGTSFQSQGKGGIPVDQAEEVTMEQASMILGISKMNLYSRVKHKKIPFHKKGRRLYFSRSDLNPGEKSGIEIMGKSSEYLSVSDPDLITVREAVKLLKLPPSRVYYTIRSKNIPFIAKDGDRLYFSRKQLIEAFDEDNKV